MKKSHLRGLILLDRDGVLNALVVDPRQGTVDSAMVPGQVRMVPRAAQAVARLHRAGYRVAIVSNQPAAAKGKTTRQNLRAVHQKVLDAIEKAGGKIASSHLCFHRSEDACACRKPRTGLLKEAFRKNPGATRRSSWMIGDGLADMQAGRAFGLKTIFLAAHKCDTCQTALRSGLRPTLWADDLMDAAKMILSHRDPRRRAS